MSYLYINMTFVSYYDTLYKNKGIEKHFIKTLRKVKK